MNSLDFITPNTLGSVGLRDGNALGNYTAISFTITGLNIANGANFWLRWTDFDATGADDGLAIDDFSITAGTQVQNTPDVLPISTMAILFAALLLARRGGLAAGAESPNC